MNESINNISFSWSISMILAGILAVVVTTVLSYKAWRRSGFSRNMGILELLRVLLVLLVALLLNQPEWVKDITPDIRPKLVVLYDDTPSMDTEDVDGTNGVSDAQISRKDRIKPILEESFWEQVRTKMDVDIVPLSSCGKMPDSGGTDLNSSLSYALKSFDGMNYMTLVSDGDWNTGGSPVDSALAFRMHEIPVYSVVVGSDKPLPDIELVSFDAPTFGVVNKPLRIPFTIRSSLSEVYEDTAVLEITESDDTLKRIRIEKMQTFSDSITWRPSSVGDYKLKLIVPLHGSESNTNNNEQEVSLSIREEAIKVLMVESKPRWEYRYLRNALMRDPGVDVNCLLFCSDIDRMGGGDGYIEEFPQSKDLAGFDVIFLGDVGIDAQELTVDQCRELSQVVQNQAVGLVFMPGFMGRQHTLLSTDLGGLYPVVLDKSKPKGFGARVKGEFSLTEQGKSSLLTRFEDTYESNALLWEKLPGFQWHAPVLHAKAGSTVLAVHKTKRMEHGRIPLIVTKTYGTGKILFMGTDGAWRWRKGVEDKYHYRFWGQVARWMAYQRKIASVSNMRFYYLPDRPKVGDVVSLKANIMTSTGEPLLSGTAVVQIASPSGRTESIQLKPAGLDGWGLFTGIFEPDEQGRYSVTLSCRETGGELDATLDVRGVVREKMGQAANLDVLEEIASVTRGAMVHIDSIHTLIDKLVNSPPPDVVLVRTKIWCHPVMAGVVILLLGIFWIGRKLIGVV